MNRQILLKAYADALPTEDHFVLTQTPQRDPAQGEVVVRIHYLSMDPFPRLRMSGNAQAAPQIPLGSVMVGRAVGQVVASRSPDFTEGDFVAGEMGWQDYATTAAKDLRRIDPTLGPISTALGVLGPSGLAAYFAILSQGQPEPGETLIINAASGSVASLAGQIARLHGAQVTGIVGSDAQCRYVIDELGFDAALDYKTVPDLTVAIGESCPQGVDVFLDLVGGSIHDAVMQHLNVGARIVLIGTIANYNLAPGEVDSGPRHLYTWIMKRVRLTGFLVGDYAAAFPAALQTLSGWVRDGKLRYRETIFDGLTSTPQAFASLFGSDHVGKLLVKVYEA